jgi:hypothetical protein
MRTLFRAMVLVVAIGPLTPSVALCQDFAGDDDDDVIGLDEPPPPKPVKERPRARGWRNSPLVQAAVAGVLVVTIPLGVFKLVCQMRQWKEDQGRKKEPWEIAMEEAERKRAK